MKKIIRSLWLIAVPVMLLFCFATFAAAEDAIAGADFNDGALHWSISGDKVLTISGTGNMPDYSSSVNAPWYSYRSQIDRIVVKDGVTSVGAYAFYQLTSATSASLPDSVTSLGERCFYGCSSLQTIDLPDGIETIPAYAFSNCSALESIDLPEGVKTFGNGAFRSCSSLRSIVIPEGVDALSAEYLFNGCSSLSSITLPSSLEYMGSTFWYYYMFSGTKITDIYYEGTLSQWLAISMLESSDHYNNLPMTRACNLYIQGEKLTYLTIPADVTAIPAYAFQYVNLSSVTLTYKVKEIGAYAFYGSSLSSVRMMDSTTTVGTNAFANCSQLKKVYYVGDESKWSSIAWNTGNDAFIDADRTFISSLDDDLHTVSVGEVEHGTVTVSDNYCVAGDVIAVTATPEPGYRLTRILVNGQEITGTSFTAQADTDYVVTAEFQFYKNVTDYGTCGTSLTWYLYEDNSLVITGSGAMDDYYSSSMPWYSYRGLIQSVTMDEGITSIGSYAFYGCSQIRSVTLPDSVETIGSYAFRSCSSLRTVELPSSLSYVGNYAFWDCSLETVRFAGTIEDWLNIEFDSYTALQSTGELYIDGTLVKNLVIPDGVTSIPAYSFWGYSGLETVTIPSSVQTVGERAFCDCGLTSAEFLGDAPNLGSYALGTTYDTSFAVYYHTGTTGWTSPTWNDYYAAQVEAFSDYSALDPDNRNAQGILFTLNATAKTATVGNGSSTANNAGYYGAQKGSVVIPDVVTKDGVTYTVIGIGPNAFSHNKHVTSVSIGSGVTSVIPSAFTGCPALASITVSQDNEYYSSTDGVLYDAGGLYLYVYPGGKKDSSFTVPSTVKTIGTYAFYDNEYLTKLTVGSSVTAIYSSAFCGLTNLGEITLPFIGTRERDADDTYYYSESFSSVFGSGYYGYNPVSGGNRWDSSASAWVYRDGSLRKVTITGGDLYSNAFSGCSTIQELVFSFKPTSIPSRCFYNCTSLEQITFAGETCQIGELVLPEGIGSIGSYAFYNCKGITSVTLPASLESISSDAFSASGLEEFIVVAGNQNYSTDQWGVLYNYDKTTLIQYPSCRKWPYYNVASTATSIGYQAFSGCEKLVNLYIPNSVTSINSNAISNCPYLTLCCYTGSAAYRYALNNSLTAWYMDNKTLQGISIYSLPEQTVQVQGQVDLMGLYVVGNYQGKQLQIDDYTLSYDQTTSGVKTVTVAYQGKTDTFEMVLYTSDEGNVIRFQCDGAQDGELVMIAVYNSDGKMLYTGQATIANGTAQVGVSGSVYREADSAKLFILGEQTYAPAAAAQEQTIH